MTHGMNDKMQVLWQSILMKLVGVVLLRGTSRDLHILYILISIVLIRRREQLPPGQHNIINLIVQTMAEWLRR